MCVRRSDPYWLRYWRVTYSAAYHSLNHTILAFVNWILRTNFRQIWIKLQYSTYKKMSLKISYAKFCHSFNVLKFKWWLVVYSQSVQSKLQPHFNRLTLVLISNANYSSGCSHDLGRGIDVPKQTAMVGQQQTMWGFGQPSWQGVQTRWHL